MNKPAIYITDGTQDFVCLVLDADLQEIAVLESADTDRTALIKQRLAELPHLEWDDVAALAKLAPGFPGADVRPKRPLVTVRAIATITRNLRACLLAGTSRKKTR